MQYKNPGAKLTEEQVREIRAIQGMAVAAIARKYGLSPRQVRNIKQGNSWKHVAP